MSNPLYDNADFYLSGTDEPGASIANLQSDFDAMVAENSTDAEREAAVNSLQTVIGDKVDQSVYDAMISGNATDAELSTMRQAVEDAQATIDAAQDAALQAHINDVDKHLPNQILYSYFCIWAEESADLENNAFEWAFGNGNDTLSGMGIVVPFDCELFAIGLTLEGDATCTVEVRKNTNSTNKNVSTNRNRKGFISFENSPVNYQLGDVVGFRTITGSSDSNAGVITAWFRKAIL